MRCKIGDLAFINKALRQSNIGLIVQCTELIGYLEKDEPFNWNGETWAAPGSDYYWIVTSTTGSIETQFGKSKQGFIADAWLTPIRELPEEDSLYTTEELTDDLTV
jgi:hypothetical protein